MYLICTASYGIEPVMFTNQDAAEQYVQQLIKYRAYKYMTVEVIKVNEDWINEGAELVSEWP